MGRRRDNRPPDGVPGGSGLNRRHERSWRRARRARQRALGSLARQLVLLCGAVLVVAPFLWSITTSLKPIRETFAPPYLYPVHLEWRNYVDAWQAAPFARYYLNTAIMTAGIVGGQIAFAALSAYAFARLRFPGRDALFLVFLGTMMVPFYVLLIPSYLIVERLGWVDTYWALVVPRAVSAFGIFLMRQAFLAVPRELDEAALIDGCSRLGILWRVVLPLSRPAVATLGVFAFLFSWNDFLWPMIVSRSPEMYTIQVGLQVFMGKYGTQWVKLMAGVVTSTIPALFLFLLAQSYLVKGMATSGLKG
ncbi:MAG: carbohydrate ABC transporter permease [Bacillota bacterium]